MAQQDKAQQPIGVFDSGIGGLTVLKALCQALPNENFVYLGDTARLPYGMKSAQTIKKYVEQNAQYLCRQDVKAIVVACNSASSVILGQKQMNSHPLYNVIEPGAQKAAQVSDSKRIGVLATKATASGAAYVRALQELDPEFHITQQAAPLLVPLVEEGWENDPLTNLVVFRYLTPLLETGVDTIIMGCTHYPVLKQALAKATGPHIHLVDSAETIASEVQRDIECERIAANPSSERGWIRILTTDSPPGLKKLAQRILGDHTISSIEHVDLQT